MIVTDKGLFLEGKYAKSSMPDINLCRFQDEKGATIFIPTSMLIQQYELLKFEAERKGYSHILEVKNDLKN
jgi:hypothetical protein